MIWEKTQRKWLIMPKTLEMTKEEMKKEKNRLFKLIKVSI